MTIVTPSDRTRDDCTRTALAQAEKLLREARKSSQREARRV